MLLNPQNFTSRCGLWVHLSKHMVHQPDCRAFETTSVCFFSALPETSTSLTVVVDVCSRGTALQGVPLVAWAEGGA